MKRNSFLRKLILIILCAIIADKGLGLLLQHFYFKIRHGEQGRTTYAIDSCISEIVILGSSRAEHHYVPACYFKRTKYVLLQCRQRQATFAILPCHAQDDIREVFAEKDHSRSQSDLLLNRAKMASMRSQISCRIIMRILK